MTLGTIKSKKKTLILEHVTLKQRRNSTKYNCYLCKRQCNYESSTHGIEIDQQNAPYRAFSNGTSMDHGQCTNH